MPCRLALRGRPQPGARRAHVHSVPSRSLGVPTIKGNALRLLPLLSLSIRLVQSRLDASASPGGTSWARGRDCPPPPPTGLASSAVVLPPFLPQLEKIHPGRGSPGIAGPWGLPLGSLTGEGNARRAMPRTLCHLAGTQKRVAFPSFRPSLPLNSKGPRRPWLWG